MQDGDDKVTSPDVLRPLIMRSLRRSNVRKKIAEYLYEISPSGSYTSDIAYNVKTTPTNVIGALRGMSTRYKDDESLLKLNIVELTSPKEAQNAPSIYATFNLIYDGKLLADHYISARRFTNIIKKEKII